MKVNDIMTHRVICADRAEPVITAARLLRTYDIGVLPVCDERKHLCGILTDRDIVLRCTALGADAQTLKISEIMSPAPVTVSPEDTVEKAASIMAASRVRRLPVCENGALVGILSLGDIASTNNDMEAAKALSEITSNIYKP